jgi:RHS repeat-associated protein
MATYFFWDEVEDNVIREYDDNNNTIAHYTTEPTLYGRVISQDRGGDVRHYKYDGQGNTVALTDNSGNVTDTRKYSAFGEVTESSGTTDIVFLFGGQSGYQTCTRGLSIRRRQYNQLSGRWSSLDPLITVASQNLYCFVINNPVNFEDPSGLFEIPDWLKRCWPWAKSAGKVGSVIWKFKNCEDFLDKFSAIRDACIKKWEADPLGRGIWAQDNCKQITPIINVKDPRHAILCCILKEAENDPTIDIESFRRGWVDCIKALFAKIPLPFI